MRIALLALHFAEYAGRLALALSAKHEVLLVLRSSNAQNELTDDLRALLYKNVTVRSLEPRRMRDPRVLGTSLLINRILRDFSPEILHIQEIHIALGGWTFLSFRKRIPVVLTVHDPVQHSGGAPQARLAVEDRYMVPPEGKPGDRSRTAHASGTRRTGWSYCRTN